MRQLNAAQELFISIGGRAKATALSGVPVKDGSRPTKYRNEKRKRVMLASTYHQNPARIYADALADDAKRVQ